MEICLNTVRIGQGTRGTPSLAAGSFGNAFLTKSFPCLRLLNAGRGQNIGRDSCLSGLSAAAQRKPQLALLGSRPSRGSRCCPPSCTTPSFALTEPPAASRGAPLSHTCVSLVHLGRACRRFKTRCEGVCLPEAGSAPQIEPASPPGPIWVFAEFQEDRRALFGHRPSLL